MRRLTAVLSAFALAVTLGACGEQGGNEPATNNDSNGGGNQEAATNLAALAQQIGERTAETNTAHMTMNMEVAGQKIDAEADVQFSTNADDLAMSMTMTLPGQGEMAMVLKDSIMYVQSPEEIEPGKSWLKIDPNGSDPMSKALGSTFDEMRKNADPRAAIEQLKDAGEITSQEEAELNGEQTTHYTILVDFEKLVAQQDNPDAKRAAEMLDVKEFPVELWVNEDGLPLRMTMDMPMSDPSSGQSTQAKIQADYTNWGEPVEITVPPAEEIAEMPGG